MDPQAALVTMLNAMEENDREATLEAMQNLSDWIASGGFMPQVEYRGPDYMNGTLGGYHVPARS